MDFESNSRGFLWLSPCRGWCIESCLQPHSIGALIMHSWWEDVAWFLGVDRIDSSIQGPQSLSSASYPMWECYGAWFAKGRKLFSAINWSAICIARCLFSDWDIELCATDRLPSRWKCSSYSIPIIEYPGACLSVFFLWPVLPKGLEYWFLGCFCLSSVGDPFSPVRGISIYFFLVVIDFVGLIIGGHIPYVLKLREESELGVLIPGVLLEQSCWPIANFPKAMLLYDLLIVVG